MARFELIDTPAVTPAPAAVTNVAFVIDESGSMSHLRTKVVQSFNQQLEELKRQAAEKNQPTFVTLITFEGQHLIKTHYEGVPVERVKEWTLGGYNPRGLTALVSAVGRACESLDRTKRGVFNEAFLVITLTDGYENASSTTDKSLVPTKVRRLIGTDKWTFVFLVPRGATSTIAAHFGTSVGNVQEWDQTESGVQAYTVQTQGAIQSYYGARASGKTMTRSFFTPDLSGVTMKDINKALHDVTSQYRSIKIERETDIQSQVNVKMGGYVPGSAFYELMKKEKVQEDKEMLLREKKTKKLFGGNVRTFLGFPAAGEVKVEPGNHGAFDIFVQSKSTNRKLVRGTTLLVKK